MNIFIVLFIPVSAADVVPVSLPTFPVVTDDEVTTLVKPIDVVPWSEVTDMLLCVVDNVVTVSVDITSADVSG